MGIGTSMKETTLHYYRDPLVEVLSEDRDVNLRGIVIVGSPDKNEDKYLSAERVGVSLECMRVDGAILGSGIIMWILRMLLRRRKSGASPRQS
mgnify:CR=1 FL=1